MMVEPLAEGQQPLAGNRVLVVDDEEDSRIYFATILEDYGAEVETASDGFEALERARAMRLDAITLDLEMPGKNGLDTFIELREDPALRAIPVCIISARPELLKRFQDHPSRPQPEAYLDKPVAEEALVHKVREVMAARKLAAD